jgi:hypothetical protein
VQLDRLEPAREGAEHAAGLDRGELAGVSGDHQLAVRRIDPFK